jgi:GxxExxY protein
VTSEQLNHLTGEIIASAYAVQNALGAGFLEKVYENAMSVELKKRGIPFVQQTALKVHYKDEVVGEFFVDLLVASTIIVELKAASALDKAHYAQTINYLKAADLSVGLLINFGKPRVTVKRFQNGRADLELPQAG